jgi:hypothetical protein
LSASRTRSRRSQMCTSTTYSAWARPFTTSL